VQYLICPYLPTYYYSIALLVSDITPLETIAQQWNKFLQKLLSLKIDQPKCNTTELDVLLPIKLRSVCISGKSSNMQGIALSVKGN
jgi:hypothetical protein